jgi:hypothetical protein
MPGSNEFQLCLHVLEHRKDGCEQRYTIGVWDNSMQPPGLRALCHVQPIHEAVIAILCELTRSDERKQETVGGPQWRVVSRLIEKLRDRDNADNNGTDTPAPTSYTPGEMVNHEQNGSGD